MIPNLVLRKEEEGSSVWMYIYLLLIMDHWGNPIYFGREREKILTQVEIVETNGCLTAPAEGRRKKIVVFSRFFPLVQLQFAVFLFYGCSPFQLGFK